MLIDTKQYIKHYKTNIGQHGSEERNPPIPTISDCSFHQTEETHQQQQCRNEFLVITPQQRLELIPFSGIRALLNSEATPLLWCYFDRIFSCSRSRGVLPLLFPLHFKSSPLATGDNSLCFRASLLIFGSVDSHHSPLSQTLVFLSFICLFIWYFRGSGARVRKESNFN